MEVFPLFLSSNPNTSRTWLITTNYLYLLCFSTKWLTAFPPTPFPKFPENSATLPARNGRAQSMHFSSTTMLRVLICTKHEVTTLRLALRHRDQMASGGSHGVNSAAETTVTEFAVTTIHLVTTLTWQLEWEEELVNEKQRSLQKLVTSSINVSQKGAKD